MTSDFLLYKKHVYVHIYIERDRGDESENVKIPDCIFIVLCFKTASITSPSQPIYSPGAHNIISNA